MKQKCKHIYGYDEGYSEPVDIEYESPGLVYGKVTTITKKFDYCPKCGKDLRE